jgi:hypothetical protein
MWTSLPLSKPLSLSLKQLLRQPQPLHLPLAAPQYSQPLLKCASWSTK